MVGGADHDPHGALLGERPGRLDDPVGDVDEVDVVELEHRGAGVEAADLEQVGEQGLEAVQLGLQELGRPGRRRVELVAGVVEHVTGHPDRRQRGPQLVRHVGDEPALHPAEVLQLPDLALEARGHLVERRRQARQVVLARHAQPFGEAAGGEPLGHPAGEPHRGHDLAGHQPGQPGDQDHEQAAGGDHRPGDQPHRLLLLVEGEQEVERVRPAGRQGDLRADHDAGLAADRGAVVVGRADPGVGPGRLVPELGEVVLQPRGHAGQVEVRAGLGPAARDPAGGAARGAGHHDVVPAGRAPLDDEVDEITSLRGRVRVGRGRLGQPLVGLVDLVGDLGEHLVDAVLEQAVAGLLQQQPAHSADHDDGEQHGAGDDPGLDRPPPERQRAAYGGGWSPRGTGPQHVAVPTGSRPCSRHRARSPRSRGSPGRARPWSGAAARAR